MTTAQLLEFMRAHPLAVQASVSSSGAPQAALVGVAVTDAFELVFDSLETTRKIENLRLNPRVAFVIGGHSVDEERTVQYEGVADEPHGSERDRIKSAYFAVWSRDESASVARRAGPAS